MTVNIDMFTNNLTTLKKIYKIEYLQRAPRKNKILKEALTLIPRQHAGHLVLSLMFLIH